MNEETERADALKRLKAGTALELDAIPGRAFKGRHNIRLLGR